MTTTTTAPTAETVEIKVWDKDEIKAVLVRSDVFVTRSVVKMLERQTSDEARGGYTHEANSVGFSAFDAEFLTSIANQIIDGRNLSVKQIASARKSMLRYAGQITDIANVNVTVEQIKAHREEKRIAKRDAKREAKKLA
jgi:hypothetical protein